MFGRASLNEREEKEVHKTETRKPTAQPLHVIVEDKDYQLHAKVKAVAVSAAEILSHAPRIAGDNCQHSGVGTKIVVNKPKRTNMSMSSNAQ